MAKRNFQKVDVNVQAFEKAVASRGLDGYKMAEEMGFSHKYLWNKVRLGYVHMNDVILLDKMYGIPLSEYSLEDNPILPEDDVQDASPAQDTSVLDYDRLYDTIFKAVFRAVKLAWEDGELPESSEE